MPTKQNTIKWSLEEIRDILEKKESIKIEKLKLSYHGAKAVIKRNI